MKKLFISLMLLSACGICVAQLSKPAQTTTTTQTVKAPGSNTVLEKLPDIRVTDATVTAVATGPGVYKLTIQCTIKNEGTAPISLAQVACNGLIAPENKLSLPLNATAYAPGCGTTAGLARETLQPGASVTTTYYCFNRAMAPADKPVYIIVLNWYLDVKELNKDNNRQNVYITFN